MKATGEEVSGHGAVEIDAEALIRTLSDLVSINSVNPAFSGPGESALCRYVEEDLRSSGIPAVRQEVAPGRWNVIAEVAGADRMLLFEAHADTASVEGGSDPFLFRIENNRLYGRGSCDTKAGLAAMLIALKTVRHLAKHATVRLAVVVDEEHGFLGVQRLAHELRAEGAVVAEPTDLVPVVASKGVMRWRIHTSGKAAHSSCAELGVNAVAYMARVVRSIECDLVPLLATRIHPLLGTPTINVGIIQGGAQVNMVPDRCTIEVDRRTVPGESEQAILTEFGDLLRKLHSEVPEFRAVCEEPYMAEPPFETNPDSHFVRACRAAVAAVTGSDAIGCVPYASDAGRISRSGVPAVILGPALAKRIPPTSMWTSAKWSTRPKSTRAS